MKNQLWLRLKSISFIASLLLGSLQALAQMQSDPAALGGTMGIALGLTETEYEYEPLDRDFEAERKTLSFEYHTPMQDDIGYFFQGGYTFDAEIDRSDGNGLMLGGGIRMGITNVERAQIGGYAFVNYISESYENSGGDDSDLSILEIHIAPVIKFNLTKTAQLYGALEIVPYSDGEIETGSNESDIERDDLLSLKLGARVRVGQSLVFRPELSLLSEPSLVLGLIFL